MSKDLGVGVGLRAPHFEFFTDSKPASTGWVEVISENYMDWEDHPSRRALADLEKVRANVPVVLHGVSLSIGGTDPLSDSYLRRLKGLAERIQPEWLSDHLCWTGVDGQNTHDLLPLPYTREALNHVRERILRVQDFLGERILVENVSSYLEFEHSEMKEWEFLVELARGADCDLLLDINNIYVSSINHGFDPMEYLRAIPRDRVAQVHLAGHTNKGTHLIDTHDSPVCEEVWALYRWFCRQGKNVSAMIERDAKIPEWNELETELESIHRIRRESVDRDAAAPLAATP